jgi:hypothetical protein
LERVRRNEMGRKVQKKVERAMENYRTRMIHKYGTEEERGLGKEGRIEEGRFRMEVKHQDLLSVAISRGKKSRRG